MGDGRYAWFDNQIEMQGLGRGGFSRGGDTGSLVWTWDDERQPVGLLFAGGENATFANQIGTVLNAFDINIIRTVN